MKKTGLVAACCIALIALMGISAPAMADDPLAGDQGSQQEEGDATTSQPGGITLGGGRAVANRPMRLDGGEPAVPVATGSGKAQANTPVRLRTPREEYYACMDAARAAGHIPPVPRPTADPDSWSFGDDYRKDEQAYQQWRSTYNAWVRYCSKESGYEGREVH